MTTVPAYRVAVGGDGKTFNIIVGETDGPPGVTAGLNTAAIITTIQKVLSNYQPEFVKGD